VNLLNYFTWTEGTGGCAGFNMNGTTSENSRFLGEDPWGKNTIIWQAGNTDVASDADGGWQTDIVAIDPTKLYRFSVFVNRKVKNNNGNLLFGAYGYNASSSALNLINLADGASTANYYFVTASNITTPPEDTWVLMVAFIYPHPAPTASPLRAAQTP
jgi:hypothetical protein